MSGVNNPTTGLSNYTAVNVAYSIPHDVADGWLDTDLSATVGGRSVIAFFSCSADTNDIDIGVSNGVEGSSSTQNRALAPVPLNIKTTAAGHVSFKRDIAADIVYKLIGYMT